MQVSESYRKIIAVAAIASVFIIFILFRPFATAIISATIAAYIFYPVFRWFKKRLKSPGRATIFTLLTSFFVIFIPLTLIIWLSVQQVQIMMDDVTTFLNSGRVVLDGDEYLQRLNRLLHDVTNGRVQVTILQVQDAILRSVKTLGEGLLSVISSSIGDVASAVTSIIIFIYVYAALLTNGDKLIRYIKNLNPLGEKVTERYLSQAGIMTKSMVVVQLIVAVVQGLIGAISLKIAGLDYFVFFAVILTVLSIVPLGGGILTIPIGIVMLLLGNIPGGIIVLLTHFLLVTNIDNVLKAKLLSKDAKLHPALAMISILSGVVIFGFLGLIIGPVLMVLALTTLDMYQQTKLQNKANNIDYL